MNAHRKSNSHRGKPQTMSSKRNGWRTTYLPTRPTSFSYSLSIKDLPPLLTALTFNDEKAKSPTMSPIQPSPAPTSRAVSPILCRDACLDTANQPFDCYNNVNARLTRSQVLGSIPEHLRTSASPATSLPNSTTGSHNVSRSNSISFKIRDGHSVGRGPQCGKPKRHRKLREPPAPQ